MWSDVSKVKMTRARTRAHTHTHTHTHTRTHTYTHTHTHTHTQHADLRAYVFPFINERKLILKKIKILENKK